MSEVAGRLAVQIGVALLQKDRGGKGLLLGGVPGVMRGRVTVIGGGIVGVNAVRVAHALGAEVDVLDIDLRRLTYLYDIFHGELNTLFANRANIERSVTTSDLVIGAVYLAGRRAPDARDRGDGARDGGGLGDRRRGGRPGRLRRDDPRHHARRPDLRRARRDPLRRHQHARRGAAHLDVRAHQHHAALRGEDRRARRRGGRGGRRGARAGRQRLARRGRASRAWPSRSDMPHTPDSAGTERRRVECAPAGQEPTTPCGSADRARARAGTGRRGRPCRGSRSRTRARSAAAC